MEVLDLFSAAAGGWSLGMHRAGFTTSAACEVEAWRRAVYAENNPHVRLYDDVRTLTAARLLDDLGRLPAVVVGSPPCQDISSANTKGRGVEGERSGLYFEAVRIIGEVRPRWFALENSANLRTRGYDAVRAALEAVGYTCWPCVVRAGDLGANHERPRAWVIGCDLAQVADPDGFGWDEGWSGRRLGLDASVPADTEHPTSVGHEGRRPWGRRSHGLDSPSAPGSNAGDAAQDGRGSGLSRRRAQPVEGISLEACRDATDAAEVGRSPRPGNDEGAGREGHWDEPANGAAPGGDPDHGRIGPGHVCKHGVRWPHACAPCDDAAWSERSNARQVDLCPPDRGAADRSGPDWSLEHLADHLRLDDGLSARLAGTRVAVGDGKGQSAASLVVEAFGDAVIPQIPEAIGRAILRTEAALASIYGVTPATDAVVRAA